MCDHTNQHEQQCVVLEHGQYLATWDVGHPVPNCMMVHLQMCTKGGIPLKVTY